MRLLASCALAALVVVSAGPAQDSPPKASKAQRAKLLAFDAESRAEFAKSSDKLPEGKFQLPDAAAPVFDWVSVTGLTPVHAQHGKPNCVAQATVAALEWNWQLRNGTRFKPVLSPQPILDRLQKRGSLRYSEALDQLLMQGTGELAAYPYTGEPQTPRTTATPYRLVAWGQAARGGKTPAADVKKALLEHGPLVVGIHSTPAFHKYKGGVFAEHSKTDPESDPTNHAVVLIGWDDRRGKGCWHVQNSWGLKWGEGGGAWVEYGCNNVAHFAYWVKAQSTLYNLPEDAHKLLGEGAAPFPRPAAAGKKG